MSVQFLVDAVCKNGRRLMQTENMKMTGQIRYTLMNDYMFKAFLQENGEALKNLTAALMQMPLEEIRSAEITNSIVLGEAVDEKTVMLDVSLVMNDATNIDLEMQVKNEGDWPERSMMYLCREYAGIRRGELYKNAKGAVQVGILDFTPQGFPGRFFSNYYLFEEECGHLYSDKLNIRVLELNHIDDRSLEGQMPELYHWAELFKASTWEEVEAMVAEKKIDKGYVFTLRKLSDEEKIRQQCQAREDYYARQADLKAYSEEEGRRKQAAEDEEKLRDKDKKLNAKGKELNAKDKELSAKDKELAEQKRQIEELLKLVENKE